MDKIIIKLYKTSNGKFPFLEWVQSLDFTEQAVIEMRLTRVRAGNLGKYDPVGDQVYEFKIEYGPGFRVYFGIVNPELIVVLWGGIKRGQQKDIDKAKSYWTVMKETLGGK